MDDQLQKLGDFGLKLLFRHIAFNYCRKKSGMGEEAAGRTEIRERRASGEASAKQHGSKPDEPNCGIRL
jgi:hypothetical protein